MREHHRRERRTQAHSSSHCSSRKADDEDEQVTESDLQLQNRKVEEAEATFDEDEAEENT